MVERLTMAMANRHDAWPIFDGTVRSTGVELDLVAVPAPGLHWRQLRDSEFDIFEIGVGALLMERDRWVGLPIFPNRKFFFNGVLVRRDSDITSPSQLNGRRVGVPSLWQSAVMWTLGILTDHYGVDPKSLDYRLERDPDEWVDQNGQGDNPRRPPAGTKYKVFGKDENIATALLDGSIDAALYYIGPEQGPNVEKSDVDLRGHAEIRTLFADPAAEGVAFFRKTGIYPLNHTVAMRRDVLARVPGLPMILRDLFTRAQGAMGRARIEAMRHHIQTGRMTAEAVAAPVLEIGFEANLKVLEAYITYATRLGILPPGANLREAFITE